MRVAAERGRDAETLAKEAIERFVDYDEWFIREVEKGLAQTERGEVLTHEEVGARMEKLIEKQSRVGCGHAGQKKLDDLERIADYLFATTPAHAAKSRVCNLQCSVGPADISRSWPASQGRRYQR